MQYYVTEVETPSISERTLSLSEGTVNPNPNRNPPTAL